MVVPWRSGLTMPLLSRGDGERCKHAASRKTQSAQWRDTLRAMLAGGYNGEMPVGSGS
jgi:hypothetical protein